MVNSKKPYFKLDEFVDTILENVDQLLKRFNRVVIINGQKNHQILQFVNNYYSNDFIKWKDVKDTFMQESEPIA